MVISVQWGKILASTGKAFGISIIGYSLAAALYYGWLHAIAAYYAGTVRTGAAVTTLAEIGYWSVPISTVVITGILSLDYIRIRVQEEE
ncbi:MAG: hypothetical protein F4X66_09395 [Chloroflexi bacterium]|nr:hypothetical protein [Chloroflexota bacterium]MYE41256.1 hypothetical protein [Chloroflexota bacterium]